MLSQTSTLFISTFLPLNSLLQFSLLNQTDHHWSIFCDPWFLPEILSSSNPSFEDAFAQCCFAFIQIQIQVTISLSIWDVTLFLSWWSLKICHFLYHCYTHSLIFRYQIPFQRYFRFIYQDISLKACSHS